MPRSCLKRVSMFYWWYFLSKGIHITEINQITELNHICLHAEVGGKCIVLDWSRRCSAIWIPPPITQITLFQLFPLGARDPNRICPKKMTQIIPTIAPAICYHTWRALTCFQLSNNFQRWCGGGMSGSNEKINICFTGRHQSVREDLMPWTMSDVSGLWFLGTLANLMSTVPSSGCEEEPACPPHDGWGVNKSRSDTRACVSDDEMKRPFHWQRRPLI